MCHAVACIKIKQSKTIALEYLIGLYLHDKVEMRERLVRLPNHVAIRLRVVLSQVYFY